MRLFYDDAQAGHRPTQFMVAGRLATPVENPDRALALVEALAGVGLAREVPADCGREPILAVHPEHYVAFLEGAFERFRALPHAGPEMIPNVHPYASSGPDFAARPKPRPTGIVGQAGWYVGDMACAMTEGSFGAALASARSAVAGADAILAGENAAYALCRPPGHHAYADRASGFCFLNNAAVAAERLRTRFDRVAILDFDTHHGDGTQSIFYRRGDVLVASCHTDPAGYYPYFVGYADERGAGEGEGCNLNLPLAEGSDDAGFVAAVAGLADAALRFGAEALVVSAGWDAHRDDPLSRLRVSTDAYARVGDLLARLKRPTLIVQEGGYSLAAVAEAAPAFVTAFRDARG